MIWQWLVFLVALVGGRLGFVLYNSSAEALDFPHLMGVLLRGLPLDKRTASIHEIIPLHWRKIRALYLVVASIVVSFLTVADAVMYEFWHFKLGAVVVAYALCPEGATSSVEPSFIAWRLGAFAAMSALMIVALLWRRRSNKGGLVVFFAAMPIGLGTFYVECDSLFRNHAATNAPYAFCASWFQCAEDEPDAPATVSTLYPEHQPTPEPASAYLTTDRPNILIVQMESFGARFVSELGGIEGVAPQLSRLIPEGIFFDAYYSSSFRTDRGSVSLQSGCVAHPTTSLMKDTTLHSRLPSLARRLGEHGYHTSYLYGGTLTNMGKEAYYYDMDFHRLYDITDFSPEESDCTWGVHDGTAARKVLSLVAEEPEPWYFTFQMLSSHEPWDVPYERLEDKRLNAFAYTDECVGQLVDSLRQTPMWDNLLVVVIPDHGYLYDQSYEDPEFFHAPMLWIGGAVKHTGRVSKLMNQSDIAATLLGQLGISAEGFRWSRNVLSPAYTEEFAYANYPAGLLYIDRSGYTIYDISARRLVRDLPTPSAKRLHRAKAIHLETERWLKD